MHYTSIFVSDIHLGLSNHIIDKLLSFMKNNTFDNLIIVGDFIDGWKLKRKFSWDDNCNLVIQKILKLSRKGVRVFYIYGNHDEFLEKYEGFTFGNIEIKERMDYLVQGKKYLILHGHQFDGIVSKYKWLQYFGAMMYDNLLKMNYYFNKLRNCLGFDYWSISAWLKGRTKEAVQYVNNFENLLADYAKKEGYRGVICGHIHTPKDMNIEDIHYLNCGDFLETGTILVHEGDELKLLYV